MTFGKVNPKLSMAFTKILGDHVHIYIKKATKNMCSKQVNMLEATFLTLEQNLNEKEKGPHFESEIFLISASVVVECVLYIHICTYAHKNKHYRCGQGILSQTPTYSKHHSSSLSSLTKISKLRPNRWLSFIECKINEI